jgi:NAD(P)-dependent dehydrogenase (short-subunit alcohol dehydrogenase family)
MTSSIESSASPLAGASVLVVGTGKMGLATARLALAAGAEVTVSGRSRQRLTAAASALPGAHLAVADPEEPDQAIELVERAGPVDHIAMLAGGATVSRAYGVTDTPLEEAQRSFARSLAHLERCS